MAKPNWDAIRADYAATGLCYAALAEKHRVSLSSLKKRAAKEHWTFEAGYPNRNRKKEPKHKKEPEPERRFLPAEVMLIEPETVDAMDDAIIGEQERLNAFLELVDGMAERVKQAIENVDTSSAYAIKALTGALKDLQEIQNLNRTALDLEEQRARIAKLRTEAKRIDTEDKAQEAVVVEFVDTEGAEI